MAPAGEMLLPSGRYFLPVCTRGRSSILKYTLSEFLDEEQWTHSQQDEAFERALDRIVALKSVLVSSTATQGATNRYNTKIHGLTRAIQELIVQLEHHFISPDECRIGTFSVVRVVSRKIAVGLAKVSVHCATIVKFECIMLGYACFSVDSCEDSCFRKPPAAAHYPVKTSMLTLLCIELAALSRCRRY